MTNVAQFEFILLLMALILALSILAEKLRILPAVALIIGGIGVALVPGLPKITIDPDLILVLFLPPLLMGSAFFTVWRDFKSDLRPIIFLAIGAVGFTTLVVGWVAKWMAPDLPWAACFVLGAMVSPPDAVAAAAVLKRLALPKRLITVLEGESLVNDATGLVLYRFAVTATLTGTFSAQEAAVSFGYIATAGVAVGIVLAWAASWLFQRIDDTRLAIILSFLVAWISYIAAEWIGASGVLSAVACGLVLGSRQHRVLSATTRMQARSVWGVVNFLLEALAFILIGLSMRDALKRAGSVQALWIVGLLFTLAITAAVVIARLLWVFAATYLPRLLPGVRQTDPHPPPSVPFIIGWAGMRGVDNIAVALALPLDFPGRELFLQATFGVILATIIVQGSTLGPLIKWLDPKLPDKVGRSPLSQAATRALILGATVKKLESETHTSTGAPAHSYLLKHYR